MYQACTCILDKGDICIYAISVQVVDHMVLKLFPLYYGSNLDEKLPYTNAETNPENVYMHEIYLIMRFLAIKIYTKLKGRLKL